MVRVGIVGCGNIGKVHGYVLQQMQQVQIVAFGRPEGRKSFSLCKDIWNRAYGILCFS